MSEINVLQGRKFEDCYQEEEDERLFDLILERLQQLSLRGVNPNNILSYVLTTESDYSVVEVCDKLVRQIFNQSLFESTQADIEAEASLRDAENEYSRSAEAAQAAFAKYNELYIAYQEKVEDVTV